MKKKIKNISMLGAIAVSAGSLMNLGLASCAKQSNVSFGHILSFNDFHGAAVGFGDNQYSLSVSSKNPGVERLANDFHEFKLKNPNTVIVSAGDNASDDAFGSCLHGMNIFPLLKALGVQYSAVGNHTWEWGDYIKEWERVGRTEETDGHYFVSSNILTDPQYQDKEWHTDEKDTDDFFRDFTIWNNNRHKAFDPYKIVDVGGHSICLIGLTTVGAKSDGNQDYVKDLAFIDYSASVHYAKFLAKRELGDSKYKAIESFVLLTHVESYFDGTPDKVGAGKLAAEIDTDIDAIISGHSHKKGCGTVYNSKLDKNIWIGQAETAGRCYLDTQFIFDDYRPIGQRLINVSMTLHSTFIDYGGFNPSDSRAYKAAQMQLGTIRRKARDLSERENLRKTVEDFYVELNKVNSKFSESACQQETTGEEYPFSQARQYLGHQYVWPSNDPQDEDIGAPDMETMSNNYIVDECGAWVHYHILNGFRQPEGKTFRKPSISLGYFDSITGQLVVPGREETKGIIVGDLYQIMSHDDGLVYGMLTLGQLCNIIDFILAGEDSFVYGKENNNTYHCDEGYHTEHYSDGLDYDAQGNQCVKTDQIGKQTTQSVYLAGPMQFWGMRFEVERYEVEFKGNGGSNANKYTRRFRLKRDSDGSNPRVWIYDAEDADQKLDNPATWKQWTSDKPIPFVTDGFVYGGGNGQGCMFKPYMEYCQEKYGEDQAPIFKYSDLNRDWVRNSLWSLEIDTVPGVDAPKAYFKDLVTWPTA